MARSLITNVEVDGRWYGPNDDVPAHVAEKITNPKVWRQAGAEAERDRAAEAAAKAGTSTGARLVRYVEVGGTTYGPGDPVPDDVAEKITNPAAWADRKLPPAAEQAARRMASERTAATPPPLPHSGPPATRAGDLSFAGTTLPPDALRQLQDRADEAGDGGEDGPPAAPAPAKKAAPKKATGSGA